MSGLCLLTGINFTILTIQIPCCHACSVRQRTRRMDLAHIRFRLSKPRSRSSTCWPRPHIGNSLPLAPSDQIRTETAFLLVCDDDRGTCPGQTRSSSSPTPSLASTRCARTAPLSPPPRVARGAHRTCPPAVGCALLLPAVRYAKVLPAVGTALFSFSLVLGSLSLAFHGHFGTGFIKRHSSEHCSLPG